MQLIVDMKVDEDGRQRAAGAIHRYPFRERIVPRPSREYQFEIALESTREELCVSRDFILKYVFAAFGDVRQILSSEWLARLKERIEPLEWWVTIETDYERQRFLQRSTDIEFSPFRPCGIENCPSCAIVADRIRAESFERARNGVTYREQLEGMFAADMAPVPGDRDALATRETGQRPMTQERIDTAFGLNDKRPPQLSKSARLAEALAKAKRHL